MSVYQSVNVLTYLPIYLLLDLADFFVIVKWETNNKHTELEQNIPRPFEGHRMAARSSIDADVEGDK